MCLAAVLVGVQACGEDDPAEPAIDPVTITTTSLPTGVQGEEYEPQTLHATGGDGTFVWSLATGSAPLPGGLSLFGDGTISGLPTVPGVFDFTVQANSAGEFDQRGLSITVDPKLATVSVEITSAYQGGTIQGDVAPAIDCSSVLVPRSGTFATEGTCEAAYPVGTTLTLITSGTVETFQGWDVPGCEPADQPPADPCTFAVDDDRVVTVTFVSSSAPPFLGVFGEGDGDGLVASQPDLSPYVSCDVIDGSADASCESAAFGYPAGTIVTLTPEAADSSGFVGWETSTGEAWPDCDTPEPCELVMVGDAEVHARFVGALVSTFLTISPSFIAPDQQATLPVTVSTYVRKPNGSAVQGAAVIFSTYNGCFEWDEPLQNTLETVAYSEVTGYVEASGHACVSSPGSSLDDPWFRVRAAGTSAFLGGYSVPVADTLAAGDSIAVASGDDQVVECGVIPESFEAMVVDGGGAPVSGAPVTWHFGNVFATRTDASGIAWNGFGESPICGMEHQIDATIETASGSKSVTFNVDVAPGPAADPTRSPVPARGSGEGSSGGAEP